MLKCCVLSSRSAVGSFISIYFPVGHIKFSSSSVVHDIFKSQRRISCISSTRFCWDKHATNHRDTDMPQTPLYAASTVPWKKPASPVSERFDLVLGVDGPAGLPAFECKDLFHLRSMYLFTLYLLNSPFSSRMVIPLNRYSEDIGGEIQEIVENRDWD